MNAISSRTLAVTLLLLPLTPASPDTPIPAKEQLHQIQASLSQAHAANDAQAYLASANKMSDLLNGSPDALLQLMSAQAFSGDQTAALSSLTQFVRMGQSNEDVLKLKQFDLLRSNPQFATIHTRMAANTKSVSRSAELFSLKDPGLIPEDIDYDPATKLFYITSVLEKKILAVDMSGTARVFASSPDSWPMMALRIDLHRHLLWATEVALDGFTTVPKNDWGRSAILTYDLRSARLLHRTEAPPHTALGDMTLTSEGDAIISDGDGGGIYLIHRETQHRENQQIDRLDAGEFISPQTPAISADGKRVFIPDYLRGIAILDLETKHVAWIPMDGTYALSGPFALNGIDGLYLDGHTLIATQNGTSPERVITFTLDASFARVASETIIERATATLGDPTHGFPHDGYFYYIANSGWDNLDDHGNQKPGATPSAPLIMRVRLPVEQRNPIH